MARAAIGEEGETVNEVTICLAYYENPTMLQRQYENLRQLPRAIAEHVSLVVVDDGSPDNPAVPPDPPLSIVSFKLLRMMVDIRWNQDACRNLAVHHVSIGWLLLTDMDHIPPIATLRHVVFDELDMTLVYQFLRVSEPELLPYKPHPNSWLMTRTMYERTGGYDERFAGVYGTDGRFKKQVQAVAKVKTFKAPLIRVPREVTPDASTTRYRRHTPEDEVRRNLIREEIKNSGKREPQRLMFPWVRVA